ncbi:MFS transporter [Massilia sp. MS-15]|uniref:MFS transporter n=1 Tax=Massilia sp. MS-15 TaxID=2878200 RepID=UPI001CD4FF8D|nr:MFS transporter [Massilia sp. MS-15]MCA1246151.1 MFS transporter [Massilia sp. MS-15]
MTKLPAPPAPMVLTVLMVLAHTAFAGGRVALTLSALRLGGSPFQVGMIVSLLALVPMFLAVQAGRWTDRRGVAGPLLLALGLLEAGLLLAALPALPALGAAAILMGCGFMLVHVALNNAVGGWDAQARSHGFAMLALGTSVSSVAGPMLAGVLVDLAGHARAFFLLAILPCLALPMLRGGHLPPAPAPAPSSTAPAVRPRMADLLRHAPLRAVFVTGALLSMGWDLFSFMLPMHGERIGLTATMTGTVMAAFGAGTFVVRLFIGRLARRYTEWQVLGAVLALSAAVYFLMPLARTLPPLLALAFVLGLGLGCALPMTMSAIARSAPPGRGGEAIGIRTMLANASQTVLPVSCGALGAAWGTQAVFWLVAGLLGAGLVLMGRARAGTPAG